MPPHFYYVYSIQEVQDITLSQNIINQCGNSEVLIESYTILYATINIHCHIQLSSGVIKLSAVFQLEINRTEVAGDRVYK